MQKPSIVCRFKLATLSVALLYFSAGTAGAAEEDKGDQIKAPATTNHAAVSKATTAGTKGTGLSKSPAATRQSKSPATAKHASLSKTPAIAKHAGLSKKPATTTHNALSKTPGTTKHASLSKAAGDKSSAGRAISARQIKQGMTLFKSYDCVACHRIGDLGCTDGVSLDGIGRKRSEKFLYEHLKDPEEHVAKNRKAFPDMQTNMMPKPDLDRNELKLIIKFLQSQRQSAKDQDQHSN